MFRQHLQCSLTAPRRAGTSFGFFCFSLLSQLSEPERLGTALSGPASRLASAMTFSGCDTSPTVDCCSFSICRTQSPEELGRVGERSLGWTARLSCGDTDFFFFFFLMLTRRRGLGERGDKILRWRHSICTHYDACRRETTWVFPETLRSASRKTEQPFQAQSVSHRTDKTSLESKKRCISVAATERKKKLEWIWYGGVSERTWTTTKTCTTKERETRVTGLTWLQFMFLLFSDAQLDDEGLKFALGDSQHRATEPSTHMLARSAKTHNSRAQESLDSSRSVHHGIFPDVYFY